MALLVFYLLLALVVSFFCSILEAVLLSVTPSFIQSKLADGKKWAEQLLVFKKDIDQPLAAILSLNTISHTVGAAGVGAQAGVVFQNVSVGIISGILTLLILIFSELIPKTLGASYWKQLAFFTTKSLQILKWIMYPFLLVSRAITKLFKTGNDPSVERSEVIALAEIGAREGVFTTEETRILKNLVNLRKVSVRDIMTPRTVMVVASEKSTVQEFVDNQDFKRFSRIPIYENSKDNITGFVHKSDVLETMRTEETALALKEIAREIPVISHEDSIYKTYKFLTDQNAHIALVVEEFGGTAGLVTMEDVLETLLGLEITDEFDQLEDMREYARDRWKKRAARLGIEQPPNSQRESSESSETRGKEVPKPS